MIFVVVCCSCLRCVVARGCSLFVAVFVVGVFFGVCCLPSVCVDCCGVLLCVVRCWCSLLLFVWCVFLASCWFLFVHCGSLLFVVVVVVVRDVCCSLVCVACFA